MLRAIARRVLSFYPRKVTMVVYGARAVDEGVGSPPAETLEFRKLIADDFEQESMFAEKGRRERFKLRLEDGYLPYGFVEPSGRVASYIWLCLPALGTPENFTWALGSRMSVSRDSGFVYDCRTRVDWRGRSLYPTGLLAAKRLCRDAGVDRVFIDCALDNVPSHNGIAKAGFRQCCEIAVLRAGPFHMFVSGGSVRCTTRAFSLPQTCYDGV